MQVHIVDALRVPGRKLDWLDSAACQYTDPELFFPEDWQTSGFIAGRRDELIATAKAICRSCPVLADCDQDADLLESGRGESETCGIRAGRTAQERIDLRKGQAA